ncbi:MAG TPA: TolC family protein, partial [Bryobacteraceae bacterium]|nr:TolC family protein [Bryobacteraceae bacterium]
SLTVEEAVRLSLERYPDVARAKAAAEGLKGRIREVRAQALPDVSITANGSRYRDPSFLNSSGIDKFPPEFLDAIQPVPVNTFDYSITLKQPLYTAGKVGTALRIASIENEGAQLDVDRSQQDLAVEVVRAAYALTWAERYKTLVEETRDQRKLHAEMARNRYQGGVATEVDVLRSEVSLANIAPELVRADNAIRQARARLNFYLVRPLDFPTRISTGFQELPWDQWDFEALARQAVRGRPEIQRLKVAERSAEAQLQLANAESRMRADFSSTYGIVARFPKNLFNPLYGRWNFGVNFTLPVFDGFRRSGLVTQATANQRATRLERENMEQQVRLGLQQALDEMKAAGETVTAARANIAQAERVLRMMQDNYKYGAATTLDIVDAQTSLSEARTNLLRGLYGYSVARANLLWTAGRNPWE